MLALYYATIAAVSSAVFFLSVYFHKRKKTVFEALCYIALYAIVLLFV